MKHRWRVCIKCQYLLTILTEPNSHEKVSQFDVYEDHTKMRAFVHSYLNCNFLYLIYMTVYYPGTGTAEPFW